MAESTGEALQRFELSEAQVREIRAAMASCDGPWQLVVRWGESWSIKEGDAGALLAHDDAGPRAALEGREVQLEVGIKTTRLGDILQLMALTSLTSLDLGGCRSLTDLGPLSGLTGLTSLNLERCQSLTDLGPLSGLTGLTSLDLGMCSALTDIGPLAGLSGLSSLDLVTLPRFDGPIC